MAQDDDRFEPRIGRSRSDSGALPPGDFRSQLMQRVARAGGSPSRMRSSTVPSLAPTPTRSGRFNARGRGARIAATFPRGSGWSFDRASRLSVRPRRAAVKARIVKLGANRIGGVKAHLRYLERDGVSREGEPGRMYSTFTDEADRDAFIERGREDRHQFRFIVSPEDGAALDDLKPFTRDLMAQMEKDLETTLDWVAVDHHDTGHPHVHVVVRGVTEDGKTLNIAGDYIAHGIRHRASEVLTRDLGPQTELELQHQLEREVEAERLTRLDRELIERSQDGVVDLRQGEAGTERERNRQQLLVARMRRLERMGLAAKEGPLVWSLSPEADSTLRAMGERGDILKTLHRTMTEAGLDRRPELYAVHDLTRDTEPVVGRVIARGLSDEMQDRRWLIVDGVDGRSHYVDIGEAEGSFPKGSVVKLSPTPVGHRTSDRTAAEIAGANEGRYSVDLHLKHDPRATEDYAQAHVRRLEALRRAGAGVEREVDGSWRIAPDHIERAKAYEAKRAQAHPMKIETLSSLSIEQQMTADGPTWLDRQIVRAVDHTLADRGFGRDVHQAMVRRQRWLIEQGLMQKDGGDVIYRTDILDQLKRRELQRTASQVSEELGKPYYAPDRSYRVEGVYRKPVQMAGGRYALIENSREFTLVPWRPELEKHIGRQVSGLARGDGGGISWSLGRGRGGPAI